MKPLHISGFTRWLAVLSFLFIAVLALDIFPALRGPQGLEEWRWRYQVPEQWISIWLLPSVVLLATLLALAAAFQKNKINSWLFVLLGSANTYLLRLALHSATPDGNQWISRTLNPAYFSYFVPATKIDNLSQFLSSFATTTPAFAEDSTFYRVWTHPPGNISFLYYWQRLFENLPFVGRVGDAIRNHMNTDWLALYTDTDIAAGFAISLLIPLISSCVFAGVFWLTNEWTDSKNTAIIAAVLWALVPAHIIFTPVIDDLYTAEFVLTLCIGWLAIKSQRNWLFIAAGLLVGLMLYQSLSAALALIVVGIFLVFVSVGKTAATGQDLTAIVRKGVVVSLLFGLGVLAFWLIFSTAYGISSVAIVQKNLSQYDALVRSLFWARIYLFWDILMFVGAPLALLFFKAIWDLQQTSRTFSALSVAPTSILLAVIIGFAILIMLGSPRGEAARILIYIYPLFAIIAAQAYTLPTNKNGLYIIAPILFVQTLMMQLFWQVYH